MTPKQGESENTGGQRVKVDPSTGGGEKEGGEGGERGLYFLDLGFGDSILIFFLFFIFFFIKDLTPDIPRSIHFGSPRAMKKFSCLSYSSSSTILTLTVFL